MSAPRVRDEGQASFLGRLRGWGAAGEVPESARFDREIAAITRNLRAVLNTRKGVGSIVPGFGLGDYEGATGSDGETQPRLATRDILAVLVPEIEEQVRRFEPRIAGPAVEVLGRDRDLRALFAVRGAVSGRPVRFRVAMHTVHREVEVHAEAEGVTGG